MRNLLKTMLAAIQNALVLVWEGGKFVLKTVLSPIANFFGSGGEPELDEAEEAARLQHEQQVAQDAQRSAEAALEEAAALKVVARAVSRGSEPDPEQLDQLSEPTRRYLALAPAAEIKRVSLMRVGQIQDLIDSGRLARRADEISGKKAQPSAPAPQPAGEKVVFLAERIAAKRAAREPAAVDDAMAEVAALTAAAPGSRAG